MNLESEEGLWQLLTTADQMATNVRQTSKCVVHSELRTRGVGVAGGDDVFDNGSSGPKAHLVWVGRYLHRFVVRFCWVQVIVDK